MFSRVIICIISIFGFCTTSSNPVLAWGDNGHRIVCAIAWDEMRPATRRKISKILAEKGGKVAFANSCNWADDIRADRPETAPHHFLNVAADAASVDLKRDCPPERGCVVTAIEQHLQTLRISRDPAARGEALRFVAHYIGDIHQPLHVGHVEDHGGNSIKGTFMGRPSSLHHVWDFGLLEATGETWQQTAKRLRAQITPALRDVWSDTGALDWAEESYAAVRAARVGYAMASQNFNWGDAYARANLPVAEMRIKMAGVRLAQTLEITLSRAP